MKPIITIFISALIGGCIGYFICKNTCGHSGEVTFIPNGNESMRDYSFLDQSSDVPDSIKQAVIKKHMIDEPTAKKIMDNYDTYNTGTTNPRLRVKPQSAGSGDNTLKSFYLSKILIDTIFKANPKVNGIRLYLAKHDAGNDGIFTFVMRGVTNSVPFGGDPIFDYVDTCPDNCK